MEHPVPKTLGPVAAGKWAELAPRLRTADPLTLGLLEQYCQNYQRWCEACAWLAENGDCIEYSSDKGVILKVEPAPKLAVARSCEKAMGDAARRLGFKLS